MSSPEPKAKGALSGKVVVVTRNRRKAEPLLRGIERAGGRAILCPCIRIEFTGPSQLKKETGEVKSFDWLVFTSANAVISMEELVRESGFTGRIAAVGKATRREAERIGLRGAVLPAESTSSCLQELLRSKLTPGTKVLLPQSDLAGTELAEALRQTGAQVCRVISYRTCPGKREEAEELVDFLKEGTPDGVLFASPSAVKGLKAMLNGAEFRKLMGKAAICSIGPVTTSQIERLGFSVAATARPHTTEGLLRAVERVFVKPGL